MARFLISAGHDQKRQGAENKKHELTEYMLTEPLVAIIEKLFKEQMPEHELIVLNLDDGDKLSAAIKRVNEEHEKEEIVLAIEAHFNAAKNKNWHGCEVLYASGNGYVLADKLNRKISEHTGEKYRRVFNPLDDKKENESISSYIKGFIHKTKPWALISEAAYLSHDASAEKLKQEYYLEKIAQAHVDTYRYALEMRG